MQQLPSPFGHHPAAGDGGGGPGGRARRRERRQARTLASCQAYFFGLFLLVYLAADAAARLRRRGRPVVIDAGGGGSGREERNARVREFSSAFEERVYRTAPRGQFDGYEGGRGGRAVRIGRVAGPDGSSDSGDGGDFSEDDDGGGGLYTGVAHFRHGNDPNLATFLLSSGEAGGGPGAYFTVDLSSDRPFEGARERRVDESGGGNGGGGASWVSAYTQKRADGTFRHYALFAGGHGGGGPDANNAANNAGRSALYVADELPDGSLGPFALDWAEDRSVQPAGARSCGIADLGDLEDLNDGGLVSRKGAPDLIVTGRGGLDVYSLDGAKWRRVRALPMAGLRTDAEALYGTAVLGGRYVVAASRPKASFAGKEHR